METKSRHNSFCARPGCAHTELMHGRLPGACGNFIAPSSPEGRAFKREAATAVSHDVIDSALLDRALMEQTITFMQTRIKEATQATQACLSAAKAGAPRTASRYAERALKALGSLGAS